MRRWVECRTIILERFLYTGPSNIRVPIFGTSSLYFPRTESETLLPQPWTDEDRSLPSVRRDQQKSELLFIGSRTCFDVKQRRSNNSRKGKNEIRTIMVEAQQYDLCRTFGALARLLDL